jgi:hypothetical protein
MCQRIMLMYKLHTVKFLLLPTEPDQLALLEGRRLTRKPPGPADAAVGKQT